MQQPLAEQSAIAESATRPTVVDPASAAKSLTPAIAALDILGAAKSLDMSSALKGFAETRRAAENIGKSMQAFHNQIAQAAGAAGNLANAAAAIIGNPADLTIKQLVLRAFRDKFLTTGATATEIRQFIQDAYARDINPQSLSPQLSRLKAEGFLTQDTDSEVWRPTRRTTMG